jgi:predicted DNA-binding transcriptional regulator AlpA
VGSVLPLHPVESNSTAPAPRLGAPDQARLIDRDEFAQRLSVGVSTLDRLRAAGKVGPRAIKCGGIRFHLAEVTAWLATPTAAGELHSAATWPPVWAALEKKTRY